MNPSSLIPLVLTLPLVAVNWDGVNEGVIRRRAIAPINAATPITTPTRGTSNFKGNFLLAKEPCSPNPNQPCFPRGGRNPFPDIQIISPCRGSLLTNTPMLSWSAVPGATSYSVRVEHIGKTLWDKTVDNLTELSYPADKPPLEPDKDYDLIVETIVRDDRRSGSVRFSLPSLERQERVQTEARAIANTPLSADEKAVKLAQLYKDNDLLTEAIEILQRSVQNKSRTVSVYQLLGDLYLQAGLPNFAKAPYQQALDLATTFNDTNAQAEAQVGLGQVDVAIENWEQAITSLTAARASYITLKNPKLAAQLAQLLGEVYEQTANRDEAIRWYQTAKTEYESLGETERLNYVQKRLTNLNQ